ncbi:MAG: hypothetical protein AAF304_04720 [Pseudomonadota bacterium]
MGDKFDDAHPDLQAYKWGFFQGWTGMLIGGSFAVIVLFNPLLLFSDPQLNQDEGFRLFISIFIFLWSGLIAFASYFVIKRKRWGWIVATIFSFNPVLWVINGIYLKNRWKELDRQGNEK